MCGILGCFGQHDSSDEERFSSALNLLAHRGPDDRGVFLADGVMLGHRRLSILDLSTAGHQPMVDSESGAVLIFNGEIYNHIELRSELESLGYKFTGHSDTEVLLKALLHWGENALSYLNGMWAFSFWQPDKKKLLLARDRFGVKPLYYRQESNGFAFSSEPKSLLALFPEHREVCEETLLDFLGNNLLYAKGESFYKGIYVLPPAHYASYNVENDNLELTRYWDYPVNVDTTLTLDEAVKQFDELFTDAVHLRLRSDVSVGLTLSGGLDSTGILAATTTFSSEKPICFTSTYDKGEVGELPWATIASQDANAQLIEVLAPQNNWLEVLNKITWHMDAPGYSPAVYPLWHLMKNARSKNILVLLEGQGADEALAGYPQYSVLDLLDYISGKSSVKRTMFGISKRFISLCRTFSFRWTIAWIAREISPRLLRWHRKRVGFNSFMRKDIVPPELENYSIKGNDRVRDQLLFDHRCNILPGLLHYGDAISMAHSVEARNPFLDYRLVEWMFRLPSHIRFSQFETKSVLREYLRNHNQTKIGNRPDKKGYPTPVGSWLASDKGIEVEKLLLGRDSLLHKWCDPDKIKRLIDINKKGALAAEHHLYKLVSTQLWLNQCIEKNKLE